MKEKEAKLSIYLIIIFFTLIVGFPIVLMCARTIDMYAHETTYVENAQFDAISYEFMDSKPLILDGEWNVYKGLYLQDNYTEGVSEYECEQIWLPTMDLAESKQAQTYQMFLSLDASEIEQRNLYLSIPLANASARVYVNGRYTPNSSHDDSWLHLKSENGLFYIGAYCDKSLDYQEILISVPDETSLTNLYNREVSISTLSNYIADEKVSQSLQLLLIGMMATIILVGFSYMILVPSYSKLTLMNLFDAAIMLHILFNMSTIPNVALATITGGDWGCYRFRQHDLGFFMLAGVLGPILGKELFDPENKAHKIFDKPIIFCYIVLGIILVLKPELLSSNFVVLIVGITLFALVCVMARIWISIRDGQMTMYRVFHVGKTIYIGSIVLFDLATLASGNRNNPLMLILYGIFFFVHLFIKAYEYRMLFVHIEIMNVQLEETVEERTKELKVANRALQDLSVRDALTRCYNRVHFEEEFDNNMQKLRDGIVNQFYLCMFDLDGFKSINDKYGHLEGDEQLIETVQISLNHVTDSMDFARIGGEEFAIMFVDYEESKVLEVVEAIRRDLEELSNERVDRTTGSFGVYRAHPLDENKAAYANADQCMYYSKEHGKNQITYKFGNGMGTYRKGVV